MSAGSKSFKAVPTTDCEAYVNKADGITLETVTDDPRDAVSINLSMSDARQLGRWLLENAEVATGGVNMNDRSEFTRSEADSTGDYIAWYCGDTFIRHDDMPPVKQWDRIVDTLREHGFDVVERQTRFIEIE